MRHQAYGPNVPKLFVSLACLLVSQGFVMFGIFGDMTPIGAGVGAAIFMGLGTVLLWSATTPTRPFTDDRGEDHPS